MKIAVGFFSLNPFVWIFPGCFLGDHSFSGLDVNVTYYISSPADCHRLCLLHRRCRLWTWADPQHEPRHGGACWLKSHGAIDCERQ